MKTKTLKMIRKYFDYRFCNGILYMRRKVDGDVREYKTIYDFISYWIYENEGFFSGENWRKRKRSIVDKRKWEKVSNCSQ